MLITSVSGSAVKVTFKLNGCRLVCRSLAGNTIVACGAGVLATVNIVSFCCLLPVVSLTLAVKLITLPLIKYIVMFWENFAADALSKEKLKNLLAPVSLTIMVPLLSPILSVVLAVKLITSLILMFVNDLFKEAFTIGGVQSTVNVLFTEKPH